MFIDYAEISISAGDGGDGAVTFRREKYVPKGGPSGGNGGNGGGVIIEAHHNLSTLLDFRYKKKYKAGNGEPGGNSRKDGKNGRDVIIKVPVGTVVKDAESGKILYDLDVDGKTVNVGFGRNYFLSLVDSITELVMNGQVNSFFLVGGCDGAKPGRSYYTEFVEKTPKDSLVLTLACGKFRFFDKDLGEINGIPRLIDVGQCNDAYSAVRVAQAFEQIFATKITDLPLFFILSWYEQKAVAILLSLFYLGIKNIRLGPSFPVFMTPRLLKMFNVLPLKTPDEDLKAIINYVNGVTS